MSEPRAPVEQFFRHELGRLVAVLTRSLGVCRFDLADDVVQAALMQGLQTWSCRGAPGDVALNSVVTNVNSWYDVRYTESISGSGYPM